MRNDIYINEKLLTAYYFAKNCSKVYKRILFLSTVFPVFRIFFFVYLTCCKPRV